MRAIETFRKNGYRQRCNDSKVLIYDLRYKEKYNTLPDTILFSKGDKTVNHVEIITDTPEEYISTGTFSFELSNEMLKAINKQIEEIEEKE